MKFIKSAYNKFKFRITSFFDSIIYGTHNHFACHIPEKIGLLPGLLLRLLFSRIKINRAQSDMLKVLDNEGHIVFVNKRKSNFGFLFSYIRFKQLGLPYPTIGFYYRILAWQPITRIVRIGLSSIKFFLKNFSRPDPFKSGYIREKFIKGTSGFLSLIDKKSFYRRFVKEKTDPLLYLIEIQQTIDTPIFIVPHLMFFSKAPEKKNPSFTDMIFGSEENPGRLRTLWILIKNPKQVFVEISDPINLAQYLSKPEMQGIGVAQKSFVLRRHLLATINRHRHSILGPVLKSRVELKENILTHNRTQKFILDYSERKGIPIHQVQKKANAYLEEIAANYSLNWIYLFVVALKVILKTLFDGMIIDYKGLDRLRTMARRSPLVLIPCHKSHLDYLILSFIFHLNHMPCPHIAAGKNLSFWPLGTIFRGAGAFFLRRTFKGNPLYSKVFSEYIHKILEEGFNIEFFIEGGRSRTGKLLTPKLGLLSVILNSFINGACDDIIFAPIYIGYDRVIEEKAYVDEMQGGQKEEESLGQVIKAGRFLKKRYGKVYVNFNKPISFKEYLDKNNVNIDNITPDKVKAMCMDLGLKFINDISKVSVVTPFGIVSAAILNCAKKRFSYDLIETYFETYLTYLLSTDTMLSDTLQQTDPSAIFKQSMEAFVQRKIIDAASKQKELDITGTMFKINESHKSNLEYYKNNAINAFIPAAFTSLAILEADAFQFCSTDLHSTYAFLQEIFCQEFADDSDKTAGFFVRKTLKALIDNDILTPHITLPDTYNITSVGYRKLKAFSSFLTTFLESYLIVLNFYERYPENTATESKDRLKKIQSIGNRMYKRKEIERIEALSKISYKNADTFFISTGIGQPENRDKTNRYLEKIQHYLTLINR
ncbi:MAG: 1-acyl-sn-glycerol-3-phosphate acyltransferase [Deltaproteobacteria bacterium]|nr:1-acyl-sn-glycerol-3-phosphate acyltransferase [Deltaproteobacteria bacterium]